VGFQAIAAFAGAISPSSFEGFVKKKERKEEAGSGNNVERGRERHLLRENVLSHR